MPENNEKTTDPANAAANQVATPPEGGTGASTAERADLKVSPDADTPEVALEKLKVDLEKEKQLRANGEAARQSAEAEASRLRAAVQSGEMTLRQANLVAIERALEATDAQISGLKDQLTAAWAGADYAKAAEIQVAIAENAARKSQLAIGKQQLEQARDRPATQQPQQSADPTEAALRQYTPRTQAWLRAHPDVLHDPHKMQLAIAAHHAALAADHVPDSDAYFDSIERALGYREAPQGDGSHVAVAAPPSRGARRTEKGGGPYRVEDMSPRMMELARLSDMKPEAWLKEYNTLRAEGKIERIN